MSATDTNEAVTLWLDSFGLPRRMDRGGERWRVSDTPTEPDGYYWAMHAPAATCWRFQGTNEHGQTLVFDVIQDDAHWRITQIYD